MQEKSGNPRDKALLLHHLASIEIRIGLNAEASEKMYISLKLCEEIGDHYLKNWARYGLAEALRKNDQPAEALKALQPSLLEVGKYLHIREAGLVMLELGNCYHALNQVQHAKEMYQRALENFVKNGYLNEIVLAQSGLAIIKLQEEDISGAYETIIPVLEALENEDTIGWDSRLRSYVYCYLVLKEVNDDRSESLLINSKIILDEMLSKIESKKIRRAMMENIPEHREIIALASQM
jgi:tetratricopeptide (TPR) repeat protein